MLEPVRRIHARSAFVKRLQEWPRGYPGDFETVEYLCGGRSRAEEGTIEDICETYSRRSSSARWLTSTAKRKVWAWFARAASSQSSPRGTDPSCGPPCRCDSSWPDSSSPSDR